jgi:hypothetical protein
LRADAAFCADVRRYDSRSRMLRSVARTQQPVAADVSTFAARSLQTDVMTARRRTLSGVNVFEFPISRN